MNKKGFEANFAVIFSIIVGAIILFIAIYAAMKFVNTGSSVEASTITKELTIVFDPMETGLASGIRPLPITFKDEVKIYDDCYNDNDFGYQKFAVSLKKFNKWQEKNPGKKVNNKYIFSDKVEQGKTMYYFSKPFEMPFKVSEIIFLTTKTYCFPGEVPKFIEDDIGINGLELENFKFGNCSSSDIKICFGGGAGCNVNVYGLCSDCDSDYEQYEYGKVVKGSSSVYYYKSLLYGAIFSDSTTYECNVKRLMQRVSSQASLYGKESDLLTVKSCGAVDSNSLNNFETSALRLTNSRTLTEPLFIQQINDLENKNQGASCELW